jgi:hypothetical protein
MEQKAIYNHLVNNRSFRTGIRLTVNEYRKRGTLPQQGFHPYSRTSGSHSVPSADNSPPTNNRPSIKMEFEVGIGYRGGGMRRMLRRSQVSQLRSCSPATLFPEGTGIQKIKTDPITGTRIQINEGL